MNSEKQETKAPSEETESKDYIFAWGLFKAFCFLVLLAIAGLIMMKTSADGSPLQRLGGALFLFGALVIFIPIATLAFFNLPSDTMPCPNKECGAKIAKDVSWTCGTCKTTHDGKRNKLLEGCPNPACGTVPQVFFCAQCSTPIYLNSSHAARPYAFLAGKADPAVRVETLEKEKETLAEAEREALKKAKKSKREEQFDDIDYRTKLARGLTDQFKAQMELWETQQQFKSAKELRSAPKQTEGERLTTDLERKQQKYLLAKQIAAKAKVKAAEECKDSADLLEANHIVIDQWLEEHLG